MFSIVMLGVVFERKGTYMSFSQEIKQEIAGRKITRPCCARAASYAAACFGRYFDDRGVVVQTELQPVAQFIKRVYQLSGISGTVQEKEWGDGIVYEFAVKEPEEVQRMLQLFGHSGQETNLRINPKNLACSSCVSCFVATAFLCCGTATDPKKEYTLEFTTSRLNLARDFEALLGEHEFAPHRTRRKGTNVVYVKASEQVEDLLTFMGASGAAMTLMSDKIYKDLRNKANRLTNCETANMAKAAIANAQTAKAIRYLEENGALEALSEELQQAARLRLEQPECSLAKLAEMMQPPISKSGLAHRLKKLESIAKQMQEREKDV